MNRYVSAISARLSLRKPQRESLELLARLGEILELRKEQDLEQALRRVSNEFSHVKDFEREFPSLCFELATGVGKTRLMGAFITYLYQVHGVRNFFVLAPNLTIYEKLIRDFTPNTSKYVFQGIAEFAVSPPVVVTGDTYEGGRGIREMKLFDDVIVNVFNVSKINSEVRGGKAPRIKRLSEYIGKSYFDYLAGLPDLVLLMDEAHRYRASAGLKAINELKPILGLELTATARSTGAGSSGFRNVIYSYPLSAALEDGFVKEAAALTRQDLNPKDVPKDQLEKLMLEDGVHAHEKVKADLQVYALENDKPSVKPFMLVVAQDTTHANQLFEFVQGEGFFEGRYAGRVAVVHSNQSGELKDDMVQRLLQVEDPNEPTEIVIHVNKLGEGWDVSNLFTIVPLRASASEILTEQTLGRGLRLPYGKRTGKKELDTLFVSAHERFQELIEKANDPNSIIRSGVEVGRDIPIQKPEVLTVDPAYRPRLAPDGASPQLGLAFQNPAEQKLAEAAQAVAKAITYLPRSTDLMNKDVQANIVREVIATYQPDQGPLEELFDTPKIREVVKQAVQEFVDRTISIPRIVVIPVGEVTSGFNSFRLNLASIRPQPVAKDILIQWLRTEERAKLITDPTGVQEDRLENYVVRNLIDFDDVNYDSQSDLLYELAGQVVAHVRGYLGSDDDVRNVLQYHQKGLAATVHAQMQEHSWEKNGGFEVRATPGTLTLKPLAVELPFGEQTRDFRSPVDEKNAIRRMAFGGFQRCLYPVQKFQSYEGELLFARILEDTDGVRWFKPAPKQFQIFYNRDVPYEPDFVVETKTDKLLCEPKAASELADDVVLAKANAAREWCERATEYELANGGKPWSFVLIPHDAITASSTLGALVAAHTFRPTATSR
ncbi:MAG TPA: DEAD/DEAH box helicase family protein [Fimbriimonadaceae bacterium]|nr:DEAD/DEAH box helicase family protein [Fimbriimonadaceae bacterium]